MRIRRKIDRHIECAIAHRHCEEQIAWSQAWRSLGISGDAGMSCQVFCPRNYAIERFSIGAQIVIAAPEQTLSKTATGVLGNRHFVATESVNSLVHPPAGN